MTNGDRLRSMTNEELASFIFNEIENVEYGKNGANNNEDSWLEWLNEKEPME